MSYWRAEGRKCQASAALRWGLRRRYLEKVEAKSPVFDFFQIPRGEGHCLAMACWGQRPLAARISGAWSTVSGCAKEGAKGERCG